MRRLLLIACLMCFCLQSHLCAQRTDTGLYAFGSFDSKGFDTINLGNLNTHYEIPVVNKPGRGLPFQYSLVYDGLVWSNSWTDGEATGYWTPDPTFGFRGQLNDAVTGYMSYSVTDFTCSNGTDTYALTDYAYHDAFGQVHVFNYTVTGSCGDGTNGNSGDGSTSDGSGYRYAPPYVYTKNGTQITPAQSQNGAPTVVDSNGNTITVNNNGTFTDTLGVTELTIAGAGTPSSPMTFTYPLAPQSNPSTGSASVYYTAYTVQTNFACNGIAEYGPTMVNLVDHVTLADGSTYSFTYEPTPGVSGAVSGRLQSITLPTSGQITYSYSGTGCGNAINSNGTPATLSRTTSDGTKPTRETKALYATTIP